MDSKQLEAVMHMAELLKGVSPDELRAMQEMMLLLKGMNAAELDALLHAAKALAGKTPEQMLALAEMAGSAREGQTAEELAAGRHVADSAAC
jgi:hypothetical protein